MIIGCLIAAEDSGLSQLEICEITGLFNHMCENYGYGLKKSAEKQNSELLNKPPFNQKKS